MALMPRKPVVGLALGSGSARGWAHFGVLRALEDAGLRPDIICGSSIGALVGASYAAGEMQRFEEWVLGLGMRKVFGFMDFNISGGMLKGEKLISFWREHFVDSAIEDLKLPFGAVATCIRGPRSGCARAPSPMPCVRPSRCRACSRPCSAKAGCWSMAASSILCRLRWRAPWARTS
jgi:NTE family protein